jgi:hypothetical protein
VVILRQSQERFLKWSEMEGLWNLAMLICASVGSLAFGILAAYGILRMGFALMRSQADPLSLIILHRCRFFQA